MEQSADPVCPVCTLTVRREIPLEDHLNTHPKDQVIRALISKCSSTPSLPPPPPLTPAPTTFQYIQSPATNNVAIQYPFNLIPIVPFPFGVPTQTPFLPQTIFSPQNQTPRLTGTSTTVNVTNLSIASTHTGTTTAQLPISNSTSVTTASNVEVRSTTPAHPVVASSSTGTVAITEVMEIHQESRGGSEHVSIVPEVLDEELEEDIEDQGGHLSSHGLSSHELSNHELSNHELSNHELSSHELDDAEEPEDEEEGRMNQLLLSLEQRSLATEQEMDDGAKDFLASPCPSSEHKKEELEDDLDDHLSLQQYSPKDTVSMRDIQTDETMPAQGELSEQESLGADTASLWGPAAEDVFSELASHGHTPSGGHLLSEWPPLLGPDLAEPHSSRDAAASSSASSSSASLHSGGSSVGLLHEVFGESEVKLDVKAEQWVKLESHDVKQETIACLAQEPEKVLIGLGEESLLVQQSDNRRQRQCHACHESFPTLRELKLHRQKVHRRTTYVCTICTLEFSDRAEFHTHNKTHPLECLQCGKTFTKRPGLTLHMKRHLGVKPYKCTVCDKSFITNQKLIEHTNGHTGNKPHPCEMCGKAFKRHSNLIQHRNWVHKKVRKAKQDMICFFCTRIFHTKKSLTWHVETHLGKPNVCPHCPQRFVHNSSLTRHIRTMHDRKYVPAINVKASTYVECAECGGMFCKTSLAAHMRTHNGDRPFSCNICFKAFATKWNLQQHRWTHEGPTNRPLRCKLCRKSYFRKEDLECHIRSHKNQRPFTCDFCGQKFARKYNCIRHMREHVNVKKYECNECPKTFHRSYYLKEHMRVHTGLKPWACHICGKGSTTKSNHNKHVKTHHARESVTPEG